MLWLCYVTAQLEAEYSACPTGRPACCVKFPASFDHVMQYVYNVCHAACHETSEVLAEVMLTSLCSGAC